MTVHQFDDVARDAARDQESGRVGWHTIRFFWEHLHGDAQGCAATILDTYNIRRAS